LQERLKVGLVVRAVLLAADQDVGVLFSGSSSSSSGDGDKRRIGSDEMQVLGVPSEAYR
jgi:hypothetical protein